MTKHALALLDTGRESSAPVEHLATAAEDQIKELLLRHGETGLPVAETQHLLHMMTLSRRYPAMCIETGWLQQTEEGLRLKSAVALHVSSLRLHLLREKGRATPYYALLTRL